jgi:hypothetical protein
MVAGFVASPMKPARFSIIHATTGPVSVRSE